MYSQTVLAGRLGQDPTIRSTTGSKKVATFSIATSQYSKGKEYTEWHTVVAFGDGLVKLIEQRLHKGDMILVSGQNRTRKWTKDGVDRWTTEVVMSPNDTLRFLDVAKAEANASGTAGNEMDDEIPY